MEKKETHILYDTERARNYKVFRKPHAFWYFWNFVSGMSTSEAGDEVWNRTWGANLPFIELGLHPVSYRVKFIKATGTSETEFLLKW